MFQSSDSKHSLMLRAERQHLELQMCTSMQLITKHCATIALSFRNENKLLLVIEYLWHGVFKDVIKMNGGIPTTLASSLSLTFPS